MSQDYYGTVDKAHALSGQIFKIHIGLLKNYKNLCFS